MRGNEATWGRIDRQLGLGRRALGLRVRVARPVPARCGKPVLTHRRFPRNLSHSPNPSEVVHTRFLHY